MNIPALLATLDQVACRVVPTPPLEPHTFVQCACIRACLLTDGTRTDLVIDFSDPEWWTYLVGTVRVVAILRGCGERCHTIAENFAELFYLLDGTTRGVA